MARRRAVVGLVYTLLTLLRKRAPRTWDAPPTTSSGRFATSCTPATRQKQASRPSCWRIPAGRAGHGGARRGRLPMVEFEADDALPRLHPDGRTGEKWNGSDLYAGQGPGAVCRSDRVVLRDRRRGLTIDAAGVRDKWACRRHPSRLPGSRRRCADGFRSARMGRPLRRRRPGPLRAPGDDSGSRWGLARGRSVGGTLNATLRAQCGCDAVPRSRDVAHGRATAARRSGGVALARGAPAHS